MQLKVISSIILVSIFIVLISLGFWQVSRLQKKNAFIEHITKGLNEPASMMPHNFADLDKVIYNKYRLHGKFLSDKNLLLYSSNPAHDERHGYFVMTPFIEDSGKVILINRGWIPQSLRPNFSSSNIIEGRIGKKFESELQGSSTTIEAMVMPLLKPSIFIPKNDIERNIWIYVDLKAMADFAKVPLEQDFYMVLIKGDGLPKELTIKRAEDFLQIRNDHLWYAITWFSLAFALAVIYYLRRKSLLD